MTRWLSRAVLGLLAVSATLAATISPVGSTPQPADFDSDGPYEVAFEESADFVWFYPSDVAEWPPSERFPAIVWGNGSGGYGPGNTYNSLLRSMASWGFVVVGGKHPGFNPAPIDQREALLARAADPDDVLFGRVRTNAIGIAGHSLGGIQSMQRAADYQAVAPIQGTVLIPEQSPKHPPTLFMTSLADSVFPSFLVVQAYEHSISPAWLLNHHTAGHQDPRTDGGVYQGATIAFFRWKLANDPLARGWFRGDNCLLCRDDSLTFETNTARPGLGR